MVQLIALDRLRASKLSAKKIIIYKGDIKETLARMNDEGLIEFHRDEIPLTQTGKVLHERISDSSKRIYYNQKCLEKIPLMDQNSLYRSLTQWHIYFEEKVNTFRLWDDIHG